MTEKADRSKRAVAYYRSTMEEGDESIETQREQVRKWAEKYGLDIVREFEDRNASQLHTKPHSGFEQLMRRVKRDRSFLFVLCADVSHWGRSNDMNLPASYSDECLKSGKAVIYTKESDCENRTLKSCAMLRKEITRRFPMPKSRWPRTSF
jgi:DNA invertase Pin-like site-specific DNA recombinase